MSKNRKKSGTEKKRPGAAEQTLTPAQKVAREDLGDFVGISMGEGEKPEAKEAAAREGAGDSLGEVLLAVEEDRTRLLVQGIAYLLLAFFGLFLVLGGIGATQIAQNVAYLTLVVVGLPVAWFSSKAMGRRLGKFARHVGVVDLCERGVRIYVSTDAKRALSVPYGDVKAYKLIRQGSALRLLLSGDWVAHPSGFHFVDINRPFMAGTLDALEEQILGILRTHHVKQAKK